MEKDEIMINYQNLSAKLEKSFDKVFSEMTLAELKKLDCLTCNADFFIENNKEKEAA